VRQAIKIIAAAVAITVVATAAQQDATSARPAPVSASVLPYPKPSGTGGDLLAAPLPGSDASPSWQLQLDGSQAAIFDGAEYGARTVSLPAEPPLPQPVSLGQPEELASLTPAPAKDPVVPTEGNAVARGENLVFGGAKDPPPGGDEVSAPAPRLVMAPPQDFDVPLRQPSLTPMVRIQFETHVLAPMAHTFFCIKYPGECKVHKVVFRGGAIALTAKRWDELERVNAAVNRAIISHPNRAGLAAEKWLIAPKAGECHDYAVTKRHELLALGWPERDLLLSEVVTSWGEHHLVLVVRTKDGDFIADSLTSEILDWSRAPYQWVRIQTPENPTFWSKVASTTVWVRNSSAAHRES